MKIFHLTCSEDLVPSQPVVLVLGYFDALHKGHQTLFDRARTIAQERGLEVAVLTFPESPKLAFTRFSPDLLLHLAYPEKRFAKFADQGVDRLYLTDFTSRFAKTSAADFIQNYILKLGAQVVVVGFDYHFGHERATATDLAASGLVEVVTVAEVQDDGEKISSTRIRRAVKKGNMETVHRLLGEPFSTRGMVVHGDARGRTMGFPTANLAPIDRTFLPAEGVYVADVLVRGQCYRSMTSVGKNVTFDGQDLRLEAHLFDFDEDIYGETIEIFWLSKIRDMVKFQNMTELANQLEIDKKIAKKWQKG